MGDNGEEKPAESEVDVVSGSENQDQEVSEAELGASAGALSGEAAEIERLSNENAELKDKYLRALADFDNLRKRSLKERSELLKYQGEKLAFDLLEVLDTIEMALAHQNADPEQLKQGVQLIHKLFVDRLAKWEIRPVVAVGKKFDPNMFEALQRSPTTEAEPGTIISEAVKGYFYKDKLLRHGKVIIASEPVQAENVEKSGAILPEDEVVS